MLFLSRHWRYFVLLSGPCCCLGRLSNLEERHCLAKWFNLEQFRHSSPFAGQYPLLCGHCPPQFLQLDFVCCLSEVCPLFCIAELLTCSLFCLSSMSAAWKLLSMSLSIIFGSRRARIYQWSSHPRRQCCILIFILWSLQYDFEVLFLVLPLGSF